MSSTKQVDFLDINALRANFTWLCFQKVDPAMEFDNLDEAWPTIANLIERRLKRGYRVIEDLSEVEPVIRVTFGGQASPVVPMEQLKFKGIDA